MFGEQNNNFQDQASRVTLKKKPLPVIVLVGPTASGKTGVAIELAQRIAAEIISADSRQIYQKMTVGTAKPTPEELAAAVHHFVDILPLQAEYSAGAFSREAREVIQSLRKSGKNVIVAGGSGMYVSALLDGFFEPIAQDKKIQAEFKKLAEEKGAAWIYDKLKQVDPTRASELSPNDVHRVVRALEVYHATGQTISSFRAQPRISAEFPFKIFGLKRRRAELYARIEQRVDEMIEAGLEKEVKTILEDGCPPETNALQSVGYREMMQYFAGDLSFEQAVDKIKQHTRNFAKRQMTWFGKDARTEWIELDDVSAPAAAELIMQKMGV